VIQKSLKENGFNFEFVKYEDDYKKQLLFFPVNNKEINPLKSKGKNFLSQKLKELKKIKINNSQKFVLDTIRCISPKIYNQLKFDLQKSPFFNLFPFNKQNNSSLSTKSKRKFDFYFFF
jgi:hypothetical protein